MGVSPAVEQWRLARRERRASYQVPGKWVSRLGGQDASTAGEMLRDAHRYVLAGSAAPKRPQPRLVLVLSILFNQVNHDRHVLHNRPITVLTLTSIKGIEPGFAKIIPMQAMAVMVAQSDNVRPATKARNNLGNGRLAREWKTMSAMVQIFCRDHHHTTDSLCAGCHEFLDYAEIRLRRCRFGEEKPTCAKCPVHCYQRDRREQARLVMRYAGPRMVWEHPLLSLYHWLDGFR